LGFALWFKFGSFVSIWKPLEVAKRAGLYFFAYFNRLAFRFSSVPRRILPARSLPELAAPPVKSKCEKAVSVNFNLASHLSVSCRVESLHYYTSVRKLFIHFRISFSLYRLNVERTTVAWEYQPRFHIRTPPPVPARQQRLTT